MRQQVSLKDQGATLLPLAGIFVAVGVVFGALSGDGVVLGAVAGALLFAFLFAIGWLCAVADRWSR